MIDSKHEDSWLSVDFRDCAESTGLPAGWEDNSKKCFGTTTAFSLKRENGFGFLHVETAEQGKVQIRLPLNRTFKFQKAFRISILCRSQTNVGSLMGVCSNTCPEQADEVEAAVLFSISPQWHEYSATTRGGPAEGTPAFSLNFRAPGCLDILYIRVHEIPDHSHNPESTVVAARAGDFNGGWLQTHWNMCVAAREKNPPVAFWGDSITGGWLTEGKVPWNRELAPLGVMNFGIGGDAVQHILWRMRDAQLGQAFTPRLTVLMIGANNTARIQSPVDIAAGMKLLLAEFRARLPQSPLLLLACLPWGYDPKLGVRKRIIELNRRYAELADNQNVFYADLGHSILEPDHSMSQKTSNDGAHLLEAGYERLVKVLVPEIKKHLR